MRAAVLLIIVAACGPSATRTAERQDPARAQLSGPAGPVADALVPASRDAGAGAATPEPVLSGDPVVSVAMGYMVGLVHVCALRRSGQVWCWGANDRGQLGLGHRKQMLGPQRVPGIDDAVHLAVGGSQSCVLRRDGQVACWGTNSNNAIVDNGKQPVLQPMAWPVSGQVRSLAVSEALICVLLDSERLACRGSLYIKGADTLDSVRELAVGTYHGCALRAGGDVWCWGSEAYGTLGNGRSILDIQPPIQVMGLERVAHLDIQGELACAVEVDGDVMCWGQAWAWKQTHSLLRLTRVAHVDAPENLFLLRSGPCMRKPDGAIACIGIDGLEAISAGKPAVEHVLPAVPGEPWRVVIGVPPLCALSARGAVYCWGSNRVGELGTGTASLRKLPMPVQGVGDIERLAAGLGTCALKQDRRLHCWNVAEGWNLAAALAAEGIEEAVVDVSMEEDIGCVVLAGGSVRCIGDRLERSLGDGTERPKFVLNAVHTPSGLVTVQGIGDASSVSVGLRQSCVLRKNGRVACWGGRGLSGGIDGSYLAPKDLPGLSDGVAITAGPWRTCVIRRRSGQVVCWGQIKRVESHDGDWDSRSSEHPVAIAGAVDAVEVGLDRGILSWGCLRRRDGTVRCWSFDQFYSPLPRQEHMNSTRAAPVPGIKKAVSLSVGDGYACAALASGRVACWGDNHENPALGPDVPPYQAYKPRLVPGIDDAVAVLATNRGYTCAVRKDRTASCWGWTGTVLGDGHEPYVSMPIQVLAP